MKSPAILCALVLLHSCSVQSMNLNFGNYFQKHEVQRGTQQQIGVQQPAPVSNQPPPPGTQEQKVEYQYPSQYPSESYSEYRSESDPYLYNISSDEDVLSESWNSSYYESSNSSSEPIETNQTAQNNTTTTTTTSTSTNSTSISTQKEHSIQNVDESLSNADGKKSTSESSGGDEVVWNKVPSSPASSTTRGPIVVSAAVNTTSDGEKEEVVLGTAATTTKEVVQKSIFQKSIEWAKDEYILSFLVPVAAGIIFAVTVICTIALCRCCRRCCRRRRFRKKCLPDSVRNLSTSDRKRLLGDMSSDDEF